MCVFCRRCCCCCYKRKKKKPGKDIMKKVCLKSLGTFFLSFTFLFFFFFFFFVSFIFFYLCFSFFLNVDDSTTTTCFHLSLSTSIRFCLFFFFPPVTIQAITHTGTHLDIKRHVGDSRPCHTYGSRQLKVFSSSSCSTKIFN